jgi:hypothetical protein
MLNKASATVFGEGAFLTALINFALLAFAIRCALAERDARRLARERVGWSQWCRSGQGARFSNDA